MKKIYIVLVFIGIINLTFSQIKSTGLVTLSSGYSLQIDINNTTNLATFTMTGPLNKWIAIGLNAIDMSTINADCITYGTSLLDRHLVGGIGGSQWVQPITDGINNLSVPTVTTNATSRTIVFTRSLNTGDTNDYMFDYATLSSLNIIWAYGSTTNINAQHSTRGFTTLTFTTLGVEDFNTLYDISIFPNPSKGIFSISKNNFTPISKIRVFDSNAKLLKEIDFNFDNQSSVDLSELSSSVYFLEFSGEKDKIVKKIIIE